MARGVDPDQKRLFVIDGSKALRAAINAVFGRRHPVQRCRTHKLRNVMDHLPEDQKDQVRSAGDEILSVHNLSIRLILCGIRLFARAREYCNIQ